VTPRTCRCPDPDACEHEEPLDEADLEVDPIADTVPPILADDVPNR
jgi:hypothetical protein